MKKARVNIFHSRFILFKLKIFGEIVTTYRYLKRFDTVVRRSTYCLNFNIAPDLEKSLEQIC